MSPEHFDFTAIEARLLHLGLPGAHKVMDAPWREDSTGWANVLRRARAAGLKTNLEMVSISPAESVDTRLASGSRESGPSRSAGRPAATRKDPHAPRNS